MSHIKSDGSRFFQRERRLEPALTPDAERLRDGLPKLKDFPAELGGSGVAVPE
jgi:hypothetical protein